AHFHSKRWTNTSPRDMCPLARYACASAGRSTAGWPWISKPAGALLQLAASARSAARMRLVAGILLELRVGHELGGRDGEQVEVSIGRRASRGAALPGPDVVAAGEESEANEIRATVRLPEQLPTALVEDELQVELGCGDVATRVPKGALPESV